MRFLVVAEYYHWTNNEVYKIAVHESRWRLQKIMEKCALYRLMCYCMYLLCNIYELGLMTAAFRGSS